MIPPGISSKFVHVQHIGRIAFGPFTFNGDWVTERSGVQYSASLPDDAPDLLSLTGCELIPVQLYRYGDDEPVIWGEAYVDFTYSESAYGRRLYGNIHFSGPAGWRL